MYLFYSILYASVCADTSETSKDVKGLNKGRVCTFCCLSKDIIRNILLSQSPTGSHLSLSLNLISLSLFGPFFNLNCPLVSQKLGPLLKQKEKKDQSRDQRVFTENTLLSYRNTCDRIWRMKSYSYHFHPFWKDF